MRKPKYLLGDIVAVEFPIMLNGKVIRKEIIQTIIKQAVYNKGVWEYIFSNYPQYVNKLKFSILKRLSKQQ